MIEITYIRASTLLIRFPGVTFLTDPWFKRQIRGLPCFKRPGIPLRSLPPVDAVIASHLHPDHYDTTAVRALARRSSLSVLGPRDIARASGKIHLSNVVEMEPWQTTTLANTRITATPALHSGREINFILEGQGQTVFFGGDCRFSDAFLEIADRFSVDVALLPVGGTLILGRRIVMGPREAVEAVKVLKPRVVIPIHEGGIWMSVPPLSLHPGRPEQLVRRVEQERLPTRVVILQGGERFQQGG